MEPWEWKDLVGDRIASRRISLDIRSMRRAADLAGISETVWRHVESGRRKLTPDLEVPPSPNSATKAAIARVLEWPVDAIDRLAAGEDPGTWVDVIPAGVHRQLREMGVATENPQVVAHELVKLTQAVDELRGRVDAHDEAFDGLAGMRATLDAIAERVGVATPSGLRLVAEGQDPDVPEEELRDDVRAAATKASKRSAEGASGTMKSARTGKARVRGRDTSPDRPLDRS